MVWIALTIGIGAVLVVYALMAIAKHEDRAARRSEKKLDPLSDVHVTLPGAGE